MDNFKRMARIEDYDGCVAFLAAYNKLKSPVAGSQVSIRRIRTGEPGTYAIEGPSSARKIINEAIERFAVDGAK